MTAMRKLLPAVLVAAIVVGGRTADAAPVPSRLVATVDASTPLSAYGGVLAYSQRSVLDGRFHLMFVQGGVTAAAPVAARAVPFDVDLGPDAHGRTVAVYSRCATEPRTSPGFDSPFFSPGGGCRIFRLDLATGREALLHRTHAAGRSEYLPVIWKQNVAFASTADDGRGVPELRLSLAGRAPRRLNAGPARACRRFKGRVECLSLSRTGPVSMDLRAEQLAFTWRYVDFGEGGTAHEVRLVRPGSNSRVVARTGSGGLTAPVVGWPAFDGGALYYARACFGDPGGCGAGRFGVRRLSLRDGTTVNSRLVTRLTAWFTHDGPTDYELITPGGGECDSSQLDPGFSCRIVAGDYPGR